MEEVDTHLAPRMPSWMRSGPVRLSLMVSLTFVAVIAPLVSQIRSSDADAAVLTREPTAASAEDASGITSPTSAEDASAGASPAADEQERAPTAEPIRAETGDVTTTIDTVPVATEPIGTGPPDSLDPVQEQPPESAGCLLPEAAESATVPEAIDTALYRDGFEGSRPEWRILAGTWNVANGMFTQTDPGGYDLLAELDIPIPDAASITVELTANGGALGGGIMVGQPNPMLRTGATIIDFTEQGRFLRWGTYDIESGAYRYLSGVAMSSDFDPLVTHELTVELWPERTTILVDGSPVGAFGALPTGHVGLVTSASSVAFDNFAVRSLVEEPSSDR